MVYIVILHIWKKIYKWWLVTIGDLLPWNAANMPGSFWILYFLLHKRHLSDLYNFIKVNDYNSNFQADESYSESDLFTF